MYKRRLQRFYVIIVYLQVCANMKDIFKRIQVLQKALCSSITVFIYMVYANIFKQTLLKQSSAVHKLVN